MKDADNSLDTPILQVDGLRVSYPVASAGFFKPRRSLLAVNDVSFHIRRCEAYGLVGESGSGKSSVAKAIVNMFKPTGGTIKYLGRDLGASSDAEWRMLRRDIQYIAQDPFSALDPRMRAIDQIMAPLTIHGIGTPAARRDKARDLLAAVNLDSSAGTKFPHQLSGGQRQRVVIARAIALEPKLLICDEPISALDATIQSQIIGLLQRLRRQFNLSLLFISHDLSVVSSFCDRVGVMYLGKIVEEGRAEDLLSQPRHPYSQALVSSVLVADPDRIVEPLALHGEPPSVLAPPPGCTFHPRCIRAQSVCRTDIPSLAPRSGERLVSCHLSEVDA